jgi:diguanylate cyclase (GGDEF)-like protein/PAS domain S-box-containing protein
LYIRPIHRINTKIETNQLIKDDFLVDELRYLDTTIIENSIHIHSSNFLLHSLINATDDLIFFKDKNFNYLGCNEAFLLFVGKSKEEMIGHSDFELFESEMASIFREMDIEMLKENKIHTNFEWVTYPNGKKIYLQTQKIPFHYNENKIGVLGISRDLTQLHLAQKELKAQSYIDPLTKTNNRRSYQKKITKLIALHERYKTPFSVIMYDIDDFKKINDTYGHNIGDKVLIEMSALVQSTLRVNDTLCRIGGEEFVILLPETSQDSALRVAEKIRGNVENELKSIENKKITISIGVCEVREDDTEDTLFIRVDSLLYESKRNGKNKVTSA